MLLFLTSAVSMTRRRSSMDWAPVRILSPIMKLGVALAPAARLAIMNALSDLAAEVTAALDDRVVEVRLDGRDVRIAVSS